MTLPLHRPTLTDTTQVKARYEAALNRAMLFAERHLPRDEALEIAHEVATTMLELPSERVTGALIYVAVTNRLRRHWRTTKRRAELDAQYHDMLSNVGTAWANPDAQLSIQELQKQIAECVAQMPPGMREVFLLVRNEALSYKEVAARLRVGVGTVHTQFSRATALLRQCVADFEADVPSKTQKKRKPQ